MDRPDKILAEVFHISRKDAKAALKSGLASLNGDAAVWNGEARPIEKFVYIMLNKPAGVLCATRDKNARTVMDLLPPALLRKGLFPAGRLDKDAEGFVLLTNDGALAHRILSPKNHVPKTYVVKLDRPFDADHLAGEFRKGVNLDGGDTASPAVLSRIDDVTAELIIFEGMFHQVKRMFHRYGYEVTNLRRVAIGGLMLDEKLPPGGARRIAPDEMERLEHGD